MYTFWSTVYYAIVPKTTWIHETMDDEPGRSDTVVCDTSVARLCFWNEREILARDGFSPQAKLSIGRLPSFDQITSSVRYDGLGETIRSNTRRKREMLPKHRAGCGRPGPCSSPSPVLVLCNLEVAGGSVSVRPGGETKDMGSKPLQLSYLGGPSFSLLSLL